MIDLRLAIPAAAGWGAAAIVIGLAEPLLVALALWMLSGVAVVALVLSRRSWLGIVALALAAAAVCCTSIAVQQHERQPAVLVSAAAAGRHVSVIGVTTGVATPHGTFFAADLTSVTIGEKTVTGSVPALVFGEGPHARLGIGTTFELAGELGATEPGDSVAVMLFADDAPVATRDPPWYLDWANDLRERFVATTSSLPGDGGDLLGGLAIGDTSAVSEQLDGAMKASSLSHLTAVSGANCAIVVGLIMVAGAVLGVPRAARVAAASGVLVAFVVLVTPEPSVQRAAVMAALVLLATLSGRPVRGIPVLALAMLCLLALDPWLARSYGFVLSVLATAGLLLLAGPLARVIERWMPGWLAVAVAVPLAAQLACQPVIILLTPALSTYGVLANVLAGPAAPVATVIGLAGCTALALAPSIGVALCQLAWLPSAWIAAVAGFFAGLPAAQLPWPGGLPGVVLLVLVSTLALMAALGPLAARRWMALALAASLVAYAGIAGGTRVADRLGRPGDWQIAACDIGQGDAVVVRSEGEIALIDTGPEPARLTSCLDDLGVGRIDLLVLTHYDLDHVGGASAVVGRVDRVLVGPTGDPEDDRLRDELEAAGAAVQQVSRGVTGLLGDLRWSILWPRQRLAGFEPGNDASITMRFDPVGPCADGCLSSMFLGDLGEASQQALQATGAIASVDVVKVAHHGSADQDDRLYARLAAVVGVISVGAGNDYGHPTDRLLAMLADAGTLVERTDVSGMILLASGAQPGTVTVWRQRTVDVTGAG